MRCYDLVKTLELSKQYIPEDLQKFVDEFIAKMNKGTKHACDNGCGSNGFKFYEEGEELRFKRKTK